MISFACPHHTDYSPISTLVKSESCIQINIDKRIQLGFFNFSSPEELILHVDNLITLSKQNEASAAQAQDPSQSSVEQFDSLTAKEERTLKQRSAISLHLQKFPQKSIVSQVGVSLSTLKRWINLYNKGKLFTDPLPSPRYKLKQDYLDAIGAYLNHPKRMCTTLHDIKRYLLSQFAMQLDKVNLATIYRWVKKAGFSKKRVSAHVKDRNSLEMIAKRSTACIELTSHLLLDREIIYLDEVSFNQDLIPIYGYSKIGKPAFTIRSQKEKTNQLLQLSLEISFWAFRSTKLALRLRNLDIF